MSIYNFFKNSFNSVQTYFIDFAFKMVDLVSVITKRNNLQKQINLSSATTNENKTLETV
jgi:hypothetical protein